ncbi:hypothetical protein LDENG_00220650 [Lucifuga dentata]|nr:hypothetical protein LDENG_00220650 [Lucifuga dentata]
MLNGCIMAVCCALISYCSLSVLCALIRPGPGEGGGDRERVDQSKLRNHHAITGMLVLRFGGHLVCSWLMSSGLSVDVCMLSRLVLWLNLPSSLVLPLLFLHRAGKLTVCKRSDSD